MPSRAQSSLYAQSLFKESIHFLSDWEISSRVLFTFLRTLSLTVSAMIDRLAPSAFRTGSATLRKPKSLTSRNGQLFLVTSSMQLFIMLFTVISSETHFHEVFWSMHCISTCLSSAVGKPSASSDMKHFVDLALSARILSYTSLWRCCRWHYRCSPWSPETACWESSIWHVDLFETVSYLKYLWARLVLSHSIWASCKLPLPWPVENETISSAARKHLLRALLRFLSVSAATASAPSGMVWLVAC